MSIISSPRARLIALAVGAAVVGPLAVAAPSFAAQKPPVPTGQPSAGANCQATSNPTGKISGRGSTLQLWLQYDLSTQYANDVCGVTPAATGANVYPAAGDDPTDPANPTGNTFALADPAQDQMVAYNDYLATGDSATGSSNGKTAISCRTDAFSGTDIPYAMVDFNAMSGAVNAESGVTGKACFPGGYVAPFQEYAGGTNGAGGSDSSDPENIPMSFPIGGSAAEFAINLTEADCGNHTASLGTIEFTGSDIANLFGGDYATWGQLDTGADAGHNPGLAGCTEPITRVVRNDTSGTTQATLNYINDATGDSSSTTGICTAATNAGGTSPGGNWGALQQDAVQFAQNDIWPGEANTGEGHPAAGAVFPNVQAAGFVAAGCNAITAGGSSGGPALLQALHNTAGGVGYADVSDVANDTSTDVNPAQYLGIGQLLVANVQSFAGTYASPVTGTGGSNCTFGSAKLPSGGQADEMGLNGDWALDFEGAGTLNPYDDVAYKTQGSAYPACTWTWDFVWSGQDNNPGQANGPDPEPELNANQIRTLYSYFTYILSDAAQSTEAGAGYAQLPESFIEAERAAFQANF